MKWNQLAATSLAMFAICTFGRRAHGTTSTGIVVETISDYSVFCGDHSCDTDADTEGWGFWNAMTYAGTGYTSSVHWMDNSVWDTDFYDPDLTGNNNDHDTSNFDKSGTAISLAIGHGSCDDITTVTCTSDTNCVFAAAGGHCAPGGLSLGDDRVCIAPKTRYFITSSTSSWHGNRVYYGKNYGGTNTKSFAFGEDASSGGYNGAGTNGGANEVMIVNSCGFRHPFYPDETSYFYGGVHGVMFLMPTGAWYHVANHTLHFTDAAQWGARGSTIANAILANLNGAVEDVWRSPTVVSNSYTSDGYLYGASWMIAHSTTYNDALWHKQYESWNNAKQEAYDPTGNAYWAGGYTCTYDCVNLGL